MSTFTPSIGQFWSSITRVDDEAVVEVVDVVLVELELVDLGELLAK